MMRYILQMPVIKQHWKRLTEALIWSETVSKGGMPEDFFSIDLMNAYENLGKILGESVGEDLVNEIFSKFLHG